MTIRRRERKPVRIIPKPVQTSARAPGIPKGVSRAHYAPTAIGGAEIHVESKQARMFRLPFRTTLPESPAAICDVRSHSRQLSNPRRLGNHQWFLNRGAEGRAWNPGRNVCRLQLAGLPGLQLRNLY